MALTVNFKNYDGTILQTVEVESGATPAYTGDTPEKPNGDHVRYEFTGWDPVPAAIESDQDYVAQYSDVSIAFVTFTDYDNSVLSGPTQYDVGTLAADIVTPPDPTRAPTQQYNYTFDGWNPSIANVIVDATYKAKYITRINKYTVTFMDDDGETVLKEAEEYNYNTTWANVVKPDVSDKQVEGEDDIFYRFDHWDPHPAKITEDVECQAVYKVLKADNFIITFVDSDGCILEEKEYSFGQTPAYDGPENCVISYDPEIAEVSGDATYEVTLTKMYEVLKMDSEQGPGYRKAVFEVGPDYDEDDLPDWAAIGSCAIFEGDEVGYKSKLVDGTWADCSDSMVFFALMSIR